MSARRTLLGLLGILALPGVVAAAGAVPLDISSWSVAPFAMLLLAIAVLPHAAERFWHDDRNKALVATAFAIPTIAYLAYVQFATGQPALAALGHEMSQYVSFILLLGALYVVAGGVALEGDLVATPRTNTALLALGSVLANLVGTTGASMLLIRPVLRANHERKHVAHLPVFFIFTVGNLGGLLTPLGDPPLFLGFLNGVPFAWTLTLWPQWLLANGLVLAIYFVWDTLAFRCESPGAGDDTACQPLRLRGAVNLPLLLGITGTVLLQGWLPGPWGDVTGGALLLLLALLSLWRTPAGLRAANGFTWRPLAEVAILFAGIFVTMVPALELLARHGKALGVSRPAPFFWLTGGLSAVLDNAPTYLTFATLAAGSGDFGPLVRDEVPGLDGPLVLAAVSCGAVFLGALSYIGNGPNFLIKAIADEAGFRTPSFAGYLAYSFLVLLPVFVLLTVLFFNR